jgi:hypothetical protein
MLIYIVYFILFMVLAVEYELKPFKNDLFLILSILLLGVFAGLRGPEVSRDYASYQNIFDYIYELAKTNDGVFLPVIEPGFTAIVLVFRSVFETNYLVSLMLFFALASITLKIITFKQLSENPYLVILFYFSQFFLLHEMTQVRIGFASGFFFIGLLFYLNNKKWIYIALILIATLFHYSAIMYLLILFFDSKRFSKSIYISILCFSLILGYLKIPLLNFSGSLDPATISGKLNYYSTLVESGNAPILNFFNAINLLNIAVCFYLIIFIPVQTLLGDKRLLLFLKCNILSVFLLALLSGIPSFAYRFSELFGLLSIFTYASLAKYLPFKRFNILITVSISFVIFYITIFHSDLLGPYYLVKWK